MRVYIIIPAALYLCILKKTLIYLLEYFAVYSIVQTSLV